MTAWSVFWIVLGVVIVITRGLSVIDNIMVNVCKTKISCAKVAQQESETSQ